MGAHCDDSASRTPRNVVSFPDLTAFLRFPHATNITQPACHYPASWLQRKTILSSDQESRIPKPWML
jgi:hypothetical protein